MVKCKKCNTEISESKAWTLYGRDYEKPAYFCTDGCRMAWINNPETNK